MRTAKKNKQTQISAAQVSFRLPPVLREFYEQRAANEKRRLSDTLRAALEDQAAQLKESAQAA